MQHPDTPKPKNPKPQIPNPKPQTPNQVFNSVWYPRYNTDAPIFGIDFLAFGPKKVCCVCAERNWCSLVGTYSVTAALVSAFTKE